MYLLLHVAAAVPPSARDGLGPDWPMFGPMHVVNRSFSAVAAPANKNNNIIIILIVSILVICDCSLNLADGSEDRPDLAISSLQLVCLCESGLVCC